MKDPSYLIRKKVFEALNNNITISGTLYPVYNVVPSNVVYPYIYIYSLDANTIEDNQQKYVQLVTTRVEVVTAFDTNTGGQLNCNLAMNEIIQLLISKASFINLSSDNFNVYAAESNGITYVTEDTETYTLYRGILSFQNQVEQTT